jgi:hypothetical protein
MSIIHSLNKHLRTAYCAPRVENSGNIVLVCHLLQFRVKREREREKEKKGWKKSSGETE